MLLSLWLVFGSCSPSAASRPRSVVDAEAIQRLLDDINCPGALVALIPDGGAPVTRAVGYTDATRATPIDPSSRMRIASVSKLFVGTAVLRAVDEGLLSLDDPIDEHVPNIPNGDRITLRMLGRHTSGLFDPIRSRDFQAAITKKPHRVWSPEEVIQVCRRAPVNFPPGEQTRYANIGAVLLAEAVAAAAGEPFPVVLERLVLEPLELRHTAYCTDAAPPAPSPSAYRFAPKKRWLSYGDQLTEVTGYSASWSSWAGDMYSTIDDLAKAARPLATGRLLSDASRREWLGWRQAEGDPTSYGFVIKKTVYGIGHDGDVPGFSAAVWRFPDKRQTAVVLANLSNTVDGDTPANRIVGLLLGTAPR
ncbi:MAG: serine hydrolase domain-containing protein [Planctomycetota bacterium]